MVYRRPVAKGDKLPLILSSGPDRVLQRFKARTRKIASSGFFCRVTRVSPNIRRDREQPVAPLEMIARVLIVVGEELGRHTNTLRNAERVLEARFKP